MQYDYIFSLFRKEALCQKRYNQQHKKAVNVEAIELLQQ